MDLQKTSAIEKRLSPKRIWVHGVERMHTREGIALRAARNIHCTACSLEYFARYILLL